MLTSHDFREITRERDDALTRLETAETKNAELIKNSEAHDKIKEKAEQVDAIQAQFEALSIKYTEREKELDLDTLKAKAGQYDGLLNLIQTELKNAKSRQKNTSEEALSVFYADVNKMTDLSVMSRMLDDMLSGEGKPHNVFLQRLGGVLPAGEKEIHNEAFLEEQQRRTMAAY